MDGMIDGLMKMNELMNEQIEWCDGWTYELFIYWWNDGFMMDGWKNEWMNEWWMNR